ncbi:MAG: hypothetical protein ACTSYA_07945 [Candidatus Kariarchaeaceae archaeon]
MSINELGFDLVDPRFDRLKKHIHEDKTRYDHIRSFSSLSKEDTLIYRLVIFAEEYLSIYLKEVSSLDMIQFFGDWRKQACLNFINTFSHFPHTNNSLFRIFGYPTKAISDRGRVNAKKLVQESSNADQVEVSFLEVFLPKSLDDYIKYLQDTHEKKHNELVQPVLLLVDQFLQKKWILETEKWDTSSNHTQSDLETVKNLLEEKLKNSSVDSSPACVKIKEKIYSPDLILKNQILTEEIFIELKVVNHASSLFFPLVHLNQLFRYSSISAACILVVYHSPELEEKQILNKMDILAETKDCSIKELLAHLNEQNELVKRLLKNASSEKMNINTSLDNWFHFINKNTTNQSNTHNLAIIDALLQSYSSIQSSFSIGYLNKAIRMINTTIINLEKKPLEAKIRFTNLLTSPLDFLVSPEESFAYRIGFFNFPKRSTL